MDKKPSDPYELNRFVVAQAASYPQALAELRAGQKRSHWSWYVFPQLRGLGSSAMSIRYAISGLAEAHAYLRHPLLGSRLLETVAVMDSHSGLSAAQILGEVDAQKFHSCLTLFARVSGAAPSFGASLDKYFSSADDVATLRLLRGQVGDKD